MQTNSSGPGGLGASPLAAIPNSSGLISGVNSGSTTPAMAYASAPSSPILSSLQQYSQTNSSFYHQSPQQQQSQPQQQNRYSYQGPHQHSVQSISTSSLTSSFNPASPPQQHQQQQQQQQHGSSNNTSFNAMPPVPPVRQPQSQYPPLVPPLTPAQYAQYHQLLGSALSSAASTPYHSNQSTPYSSMPASPILDHQQLSDPNMLQKPKRRQVKNAC
ncbi:hypothetical protein BGZ65_000269, partial [Modicella reniformis]